MNSQVPFTFTVEIKSAEGGDDSKQLVREMADIYTTSCRREGFQIKSIEKYPQRTLFHMTGQEAHKFFSYETGGHRWQHVPNNDPHGRVHTSTVTVSVMVDSDEAFVTIDRRDVERKYTRGSGNGGQNVNKVSSSVILHHIPTGHRVRINGRDQHRNEIEAWKVLTDRVNDDRSKHVQGQYREEKKSQVGCGMRGDKRRTYRVRDNRVIDDVTGNRCSLENVRKGNLRDLHPSA